MTLARSTVASVVAELERYMAGGTDGTDIVGARPIKHFLGGRDGAAAYSGERIVWIPKKRRDIQPITGQPDEGDAVKEKQTILEVSCYADDFGRLEQIADALVAALDDVLSDHGYTLHGEGEFGEPGADARGYSFTRIVELRAPVFRGIFIQGHVATVTPGVGVISNPAADPPQTPETIPMPVAGA